MRSDSRRELVVRVGAITAPLSIALLASLGCQSLQQASQSGDLHEAGSSSSSGGPYPAHFDERPDDEQAESGASESSTGVVPASIAGAHDGVYTGSIQIDFAGAGACTGVVTIVVDVAADPPIAGDGSCHGQIFGVADGGETELDGVLDFAEATGHASQVFMGSALDVAWEGTFGDANFTGTFEGTYEFDGQSRTFTGVWNADRP